MTTDTVPPTPPPAGDAPAHADAETLALKAYAEQCDAWERMGVLDDAPDYEEWLEQQYDAHLLSIATWRERWTRRTKQFHALEAANAAANTALGALVSDMREVDWTYVPSDMQLLVANVLGQSNAKTKRYLEFLAEEAAKESDDAAE